MAAELPKDAKISRDAKVLMQEMVTEFICFITAEANDFSVAEGKKAITLDDQLAAFDSLDLACYLPVLEAAAKVLPNYKSGRAHDVDHAANPPMLHEYHQQQHALPQHQLERSMTTSTHSILSVSTGSNGYPSSESMFGSTDDGLSDASWNSSNDMTRMASLSASPIDHGNLFNTSEATVGRVPLRAARPVVAKPVMSMHPLPYGFNSTMHPMPVCTPTATPVLAPRVHPAHVPPPMELMSLPREFPGGYYQPSQQLSAPLPSHDQFRRNHKAWTPPNPF